MLRADMVKEGHGDGRGLSAGSKRIGNCWVNGVASQVEARSSQRESAQLRECSTRLT